VFRSVYGTAGRAGNAGIEQLRHVHRIEYIRTIAKVTAHFDLAALGQDGSCLGLTQPLQHAAHAFARTTATKKHGSRFEKPNIIFTEEPVQYLGIGKRP
jgi:hypothetical protein